MLMSAIIKTSENFAKKEYAQHDKQHQWKHVEEVMTVALKLAKSYPEVDLEILKLAVIFHDISYETYQTHVDESVAVAKKFLRENNYPEKRIQYVLAVMIAHSGPHRKKLSETDLIEGKIIYDADKFKPASATKEGFAKYYPKLYLAEIKKLLTL